MGHYVNVVNHAIAKGIRPEAIDRWLSTIEDAIRRESEGK